MMYEVVGTPKTSMMYEVVGAPKTLGFFAIFAFDGSARQLRRTSEGAGASRRLFDGADTTGEIRFTSVMPQRKQKRRILFTFGMSCPRDHRKRQSERSPARAASIIQKGLFDSFRSLMNDGKNGGCDPILTRRSFRQALERARDSLFRRET